MLNRYREVERCKEDIGQFIEIAQEDIADLEYNDIVSIVKGMMFIKKTYAFPEQKRQHYYECLVTDILNLIHTFSQNSIRVYYTTYRSLIENLVRVILRYENTNATGVRNMFNELRDKFESSNKEFIDYIEGEYGKCCEVIHSNYKANLPIYEYYEEIIKVDELSIKKKSSMAKQLSSFYLKCKMFMVKNDYIQVNNAFHNQKEVLFFLIGKNLYNIFINNCDNL